MAKIDLRVYHKIFVSFFIFREYHKIIGNSVLQNNDGKTFDFGKYNESNPNANMCFEALYIHLKPTMQHFADESGNLFDKFVENELDYSYIEIFSAVTSVFIHYFAKMSYDTKQQKENNKLWLSYMRPYCNGMLRNEKHKEIIDKIEKFLVATFPEGGYI